MTLLLLLSMLSENGYWPTGILDPMCPHQYAYRVEPGHAFMFLRVIAEGSEGCRDFPTIYAGTCGADRPATG